jgi:hypothetical protein
MNHQGTKRTKQALKALNLRQRTSDFIIGEVRDVSSERCSSLICLGALVV